MRGGQVYGVLLFPNASPTAPVFPAAHFLDEAPAPVNRPRWHRAQNACLSIENSKIAASGCFAISNTRHELRHACDVREIHVVHHPVPNCTVLPRKKSRANVLRPDVACEICRRKTGGHAGWPTIFSPPRWNFSAVCARWNWDSSHVGLTDVVFQFKAQIDFMAVSSGFPLPSATGGGIEGERWECSRVSMLAGATGKLPPLTLTLSPLRGEGNACSRVLLSPDVRSAADAIRRLFLQAFPC